MYLVAGLGNPGNKYKNTRHNIGFQFLDYLAKRHDSAFKESKWKADVVKANLWGHQAVLVKPSTYMNRSGQAVGAIARYYQLATEEIIVIHDDLDLGPGRIKIVYDRGAGGHNGIRSIIEGLGAKDFSRIRVGVGRPNEQMKVSDYVLSKFSADEGDLLNACLTEAERGLRMILDDGVMAAMNEINGSK